jgi:hypothetical protein
MAHYSYVPNMGDNPAALSAHTTAALAERSVTGTIGSFFGFLIKILRRSVICYYGMKPPLTNLHIGGCKKITHVFPPNAI